MVKHLILVVDFIKEYWQWILGIVGTPTLCAILFLTVGKMWFKNLFPIRLKVFHAEFGFRNHVAGYLDDGTPISLLWPHQQEGYLSITLKRRPRLDEFDEFYIEIPKIGVRANGDVASLYISDHSPKTIEFSVGDFGESEQQEWKTKLTKGTEILIKVKAGWRHRWPVTKLVRL